MRKRKTKKEEPEKKAKGMYLFLGSVMSKRHTLEKLYNFDQNNAISELSEIGFTGKDIESAINILNKTYKKLNFEFRNNKINIKWRR